MKKMALALHGIVSQTKLDMTSAQNNNYIKWVICS